MVAREKSLAREPRIVSRAFVAVASVFSGVASVDDPLVSIGLPSVVVTGLGMARLFFIPAASSPEPPEVIRRRAAERRAGANPAGLDDAGSP
ncbi:hypothetical protein [Streptomyces sp. NPDC052015]|uniref:hypothetical protein n=1 Tax=Streptomyces sp. NPDC052015 TaxID=3154755 RepID=UPI003412B269